MADELWQPTTFLRYVLTVDSSSRVALIQTDSGPAYLKAMNNPEGPHVLACDWLGTQLARRFGLQTFEVAVLELTEVDEIPLNETTRAQTGPAFVSKAEKGITMGGQRILSSVRNIEDLPRLIVYDTWVRNCDRYAPGLGKNGRPRINPDNLFLSTEGAPEGEFILKAIDQGHILTCGKPLNRGLAAIDLIRDNRVYGLFPFFRGFVETTDFDRSIATLTNVRSSLWEDLLADIPVAWQVTDEAKAAINRFLLERARFLTDNVGGMISKELNPDMLDFDSNQGGP